MSDQPKPKKPLFRLVYSLFVGFAILFTGIIAFYAGLSIKSNENPKIHPLSAYASGDLVLMEFPSSPKTFPQIDILDPSGKPMQLSAFKGKPVLVYLWASWCSPCIKEMPNLADIKMHFGEDLHIIAISVDRMADREKARAALAKLSNDVLDFYQDENMALSLGGYKISAFPFYAFYDTQGVEQGRFLGSIDLEQPDIYAFIEQLIALGSISAE